MSGSHIVVVLRNNKGDVEEHRLCDKHIIRLRSHHPQWPWWTFRHAGYCPSSSWSRQTNPKIWESDTTLTAYLPPSGCRIVQRNRCTGKSDQRYLGYLTTLVECKINDNIGRMSDKWQHWSNVIEVYQSAMMTN